MRKVNDKLEKLSRSGIRMILDMALARGEAYHLEIGDPSFRTPQHIQEAAYRAMRDGFTGYTPHGGYLSLREAILERVRGHTGIPASLEQIEATPGGVFALCVAIMAVTETGDEILLPDPGFPNYCTQVVSVGGRPVYYRLDPQRGYEPDLDELADLVGPRTRALLINTPSNPTGVAFSRSTIERLVEFAERHDLYLISDEVYEDILYTGEHFSPAVIDPNNRVIVVNSFSKTYAMTGWRLGYYVAPTSVVTAMHRLQEAYVSCPSAVSQKAAEAALKGPQDCVAAMVRTYRERKEICETALGAAGIAYTRPQGAFYLVVDITPTGMKSYDFAVDLVRTTGAAVAPGLTFGPGSDHFVRLSFCADSEQIAEGMRRLCAYYQERVTA